MTHPERLSVLKDLLILAGHFTIIPASAGAMWDIYMRCEQRDAFERLRRWVPEPLVTVAVVLRSMESDFDNIDRDIRTWLRVSWPKIGNPLLFAMSLDPTETHDRERHILQLMGWCGGEEMESEGIDFGLAANRIRSYLQNAPETLDSWFIEDAKKFLEKHADALANLGVSPLLPDSELAVAVLLGATPEKQLQACITLLDRNRLLGVCMLVLVYLGPRYVILTGDAMKSAMSTIPNPPVELGDGALMRISAKPRRRADAGAMLDALEPGVKAWLDLEIAHENFHSEDSADLSAAIQRMRASEPKLQRVYASLGQTSNC